MRIRATRLGEICDKVGAAVVATRPKRAVLSVSKEIDIIWWIGAFCVAIAVVAYIGHH